MCLVWASVDYNKYLGIIIAINFTWKSRALNAI